MEYQRPLLDTLLSRIREPRKFIQVVAGPRQVGKTTIALALKDRAEGLVEYHSADAVSAFSAAWIDQIWESLRIRMRTEEKTGLVLVLDDIQRISGWSAAIKRHWDRDTGEDRDIKLVLFGSSSLLQDDLSKTLMGSYELSYCGHWGLAEMQEAFGFSAEQYQWFGGYPGAAAFVGDEPRFKEYIPGSVIEPTLIRDIFMTTTIEKPALLRQLFEVGTGYSAQIMSYSKMLGQLRDAGNTTTLAKYLKLLEQAGLISGLNKYSGRAVETKGTIPKLQVHNTALLSAMKGEFFGEARADRSEWGMIVKNSVGAHLASLVNKHPKVSLYYWRENNLEIDYVVAYGNRVIGIEVEGGEESIQTKAAEKFKERFPNAGLMSVGAGGIPYETFMKAKLSELFSGL